MSVSRSFLSPPLLRIKPFARSFSSSKRRLEINKLASSAKEAIKDLQSNTTLLVVGFGASGVPSTLINVVRDRKDLSGFTVVSNNAGMPGVGLGQLLETKQISTMIASYIGENKVMEKMYLTGELTLELTPQGTIAEKCAAGATGVPAFYTPTAYGTIVQTGKLPTRYNSDGSIHTMSKVKETREFNGRMYVMEEAIFADYAFVRVAKADKFGNCQFRKAQNNFNEAMGKNAALTLVEADEIVQVGEIAPENVHLPGVYVHKVIQSTERKVIEKKTFKKSAEDRLASVASGAGGDKRERVVRRAAQELKDGMYVNLGIDLANFMLPGKVKGIGGAMDLVANPSKTKVVVTMEHVDKKGNPKILKDCTFPLTDSRCVSTIITDLAVFTVDFNKGLTLIEVADGVTANEIKAKTEAPFHVAENLRTMQLI